MTRSDTPDTTEATTMLGARPLPATGPHAIALWDGGAAMVPLPGTGTVSVGRSKVCDLRIDHPSVSRQHLILRLKVGPDRGLDIRVEDAGSSNGTCVNGEKMPRRSQRAIAAGDRIELGEAVLVIQRGGAVHATTPPQVRAPKGRSKEPGPILVSPAMKKLLRTIDLVAGSRLGVLLQGETGVGKGVLAELLHQRSPRAARRFVCVNCAAMPEQLLESELFGHERGAFTGALEAKPGLLELAHGGTFLLDEVAELTPVTQAKLLRVLEAGELLRVGGLRPRSIDVRIVAATNQTLDLLVRDGRFRRDLYYRINGITLTIPPLRERLEDIEPLARSFLASATSEQRMQSPALAPSTLDVLMAHPWPGNVRELRNVIARAALLSGGDPVEAQHLALSGASHQDASEPSPRAASDSHLVARSSDPVDLKAELGSLERQRIVEALKQTGGNQTRAAKLLGISRRTLVKRLDTYGVPRPRKRGRARGHACAGEKPKRGS